MRKRTSSGCYSGKLDIEMGSNIDLSLLRRPLTPFTDFSEAKSAFEKGPSEVRHLLLYECSLIYECNICRNMFRSLANFISHKRVFCCKFSNEYNGSSHNDTNGKDGMRIKKKSHGRDCIQLKKENGLDAKVEETPEICVKSNINNSDDETEKGDTVRVVQNGGHRPKGIIRKSVAVIPPIDQSNQIQMSSYVFQCPSCSLTFLKSSAVIRHLEVAHNVPIRRTRMMRDSILKRPAQSTDVNVKSNQELKGLLTNEPAVVTQFKEEKEKINNSEMEKKSSKCIFCQKSFERLVALATHQKNCRSKLDILGDSVPDTPSEKRMKLQVNANSTPKKPAIAADIGYQLADNTEDDVKHTFVSLEHQSFGAGLHTVSLDKLDISAGESTNASLTEEDTMATGNPAAESIEQNSSNVSITSTTLAKLSIKKQRSVRTSGAVKQSCRCKICDKPFNALSNLRRHISMFHYRARKFGCGLCEYCAFRRYDIINHLNFVHKMTNEQSAESSDLVRVNDVPYTKDDMDEDILLCSDNEQDKDKVSSEALNGGGGGDDLQNSLPTQPEKRQRRHNKNTSIDEGQSKNNKDALNDTNMIEMKLTRQKLRRSQSQTLSSSTEIVHSTKSTQKRPMRNRIKPVNKDFVYDLNEAVPQPAVLGTENETYHLRGSKRRNTLNSTNVEIPPVAGFDAIKPKIFSNIKGTVRRTCLLLVSQGLAASSTPPEIPTERPQMRPRLISVQRTEVQAGPIIETTELDVGRLKSLPLCDDSYLEKITKESVGSFKMKPCLGQHHSALDSLLQKVDSSFQMNGSIRNTSNQIRIETNIKEENTELNFLNNPAMLSLPGSNNNNNGSAVLSEIPAYFTPPEQDIPKAYIPLKPQKRLSSLDRLTETINSFENFYTNAAPLEN